MSERTKQRSGPLQGLRIVEMQGLGPTPFAAMWFADMGADVVRIQRPNLKPLIPMKQDVLNRGRGFVELDLKSETDRARARALINHADMLIEGMRPGVMERLGLGPEAICESNPALVYGRMTGWGQTGPLAHTAGHDINYIALTGALHAIGPRDAPTPPLNLLGDFGGGAMYLVAGLMAALISAKHTGRGQVVDCAISDGTAHLTAMIHGMHGNGIWQDQRKANLLDGAAPYYTTYECACGGHMAVGALEPPFYTALLAGLELDENELPDRMNPANWSTLRSRFTACFASKSRNEWTRIFEQTDACVTPVLCLDEAPGHPHNIARASFTTLGDLSQPSPAPRLSATPGSARIGEETSAMCFEEVLDAWATEPRGP
jgi:alpha-methylacyl-CoA racemase